MSKELKQYRLLKDLPNINAGADLVKEKSHQGRYWTTDKGGKLVCLTPELVEHEGNSQWFEEVPVVSEKVKVGKMSCHEQGSMGYGDLKWTLQFRTNKHIHYDNAIKLCNVLESALNDTVVDYNFDAYKPIIEKHKQASESFSQLKTDTVVENKFDGKKVNKYLIDEFGQTGKTEPLRFQKRYSQSEVDAIRKEAFTAGRETHFLAGMRYDNVEEYLKTFSNAL